MAKISKAFLGTLLATSGWFQNMTDPNEWVDCYQPVGLALVRFSPNIFRTIHWV